MNIGGDVDAEGVVTEASITGGIRGQLRVIHRRSDEFGLSRVSDGRNFDRLLDILGD